MASPDVLRDEIDRICNSIGAPVAVRSSATWEDNAASAHAGATMTVLDVTGTDAVLGAVRDCLDATADAQKAHGTSGELAILVQRLVPADWAGVAFSADPLTGERDVVRIAATPGLGEALVQGEVVGIDVTVRGRHIDGDLGALDADLALAVAVVTRKIEAELGGPQDVEWAITDGHVHVLQARPITVLPVEPTYPAGNNWQKDTAHCPEPITPFGWSASALGAEDVRGVFDEAGVLIRGLEEVFVGGEIYGRLSRRSGRRTAPAHRRRPSCSASPPASRRRSGGGWPSPSRWWPPACSSGGPTTGTGGTEQDMSRREAELRSVDLAALDVAALVVHLDRCIALVRDGQRIHFRLVMPLFGALYRLPRGRPR